VEIWTTAVIIFLCALEGTTKARQGGFRKSYCATKITFNVNIIYPTGA